MSLRLGRVARTFLQDRWAIAGAVLLLGIIALAALAGVLTGDDPFDIVGAPDEPPFGEFLLGTDSLGRSIFAGIAHGARVSLAIGLITTLISTTVGIVIGGLAGYFGGWIDDVLMRLTEFFQTVPAMLFAIVVVAILQPSIVTEIGAIALVSWAVVARLARAEFMRLRHREFVVACVAMGMKSGRIMLQQILPNAMSAIVVTASITVATSILLEAGLSFLGLGDPNVMSWGLMIGAGRTELRTAWWISGLPGLALLLTVLAINLIGDGLNEAFNPRNARHQP
jgi:peptide/nickel transport system permease protein